MTAALNPALQHSLVDRPPDGVDGGDRVTGDNSERTEHIAAPIPDLPATTASPASVLDPDHLAKLVHELKTPLTAIAAAAEIMRDERLGAMGNPHYLGYAADIHENATHALDVIVSLLTEHTKAGTAQPNLIALDLNALTERTVSSVQALAQSQQLKLRFSTDNSRPRIVANPTSLRQILLNLLTNAIKFTPPGGDIEVETGYLNDGCVFLSVSDTGCGINASQSAASSAAAEQTDTPLSWLSSNGIGLPLIQRLVREMSAKLEIESGREKGTSVRILFGEFARSTA